MTHRDRLLAAIDGHPTDQLPWAPRMDLWSISLAARGDLPTEFTGLDTAGISDVLGVACHAVRGDFTIPRDPGDLILRGLGFDNHPDYPFRVELDGLEADFHSDGENLRTTFRTPAGDIHTHLQMTAAMKREGISLPFFQSYAIESVDDLDAVARIFEHLRVVPTPERYAAFHQRIGDRGLAVAAGPLAASPIHLMLHELMAMDRFYYMYADARQALEDLALHMEPFYQAALEAVALCDAEVVFWGANYDRDLTWPPFFREQITPWLQRVADRLHAAGKRLLTHTDGENEGLLPLYPECRIDVAESVCPQPMTRCTLRQVRDGLRQDIPGQDTPVQGITVWGGIPSVALLPDSMSGAAFEDYLDGVFAELGSGDHLILGVSDNVPPDADLDRLARITERAATFGPVTPQK